MANVFDNVGSANLRPRVDQDGRVFYWVKAHAALTADTPYGCVPTEDGLESRALSDDAYEFRIVVPTAAVSSGDYAWMQTGGPKTALAVGSVDVDTAGHFWHIHDGALQDGGTVFDASTFAVAAAATDTTADTCDVILLDMPITTST